MYREAGFELASQAFWTAVMSSIGGASADDTDAFLKMASGTFADIETMSWMAI